MCYNCWLGFCMLKEWCHNQNIGLLDTKCNFLILESVSRARKWHKRQIGRIHQSYWILTVAHEASRN